MQQTTLFDCFRPVDFTRVRFDGTDVTQRDQVRLGGQMKRVFDVLKGGEWLTNDELANRTGDPPASVERMRRYLTAKRFGGHSVEKRRRGDGGHWEYRLTVKG